MAPSVAMTVTTPAPTAVARPIAPSVLLTVAMPPVDGDHVTAEVRSWVDPSEKVPVAVSCLLAPIASVAPDGAIESATSEAALTVSVEAPWTEPTVAVIVVPPAESALAAPLEETVATAKADEVQVALVVRSCQLPSE